MTKPPPTYPPNAKPFLSDPQLSLTLHGDRQSGGPLEVVGPFDPTPTSVDLLPAQWTILAELFLAAIRAKHWNDAHVKSSTLADQLDAYDVSATPTNSTVHKNVNGVRSALASAGIHLLGPDADLDPMEWAKLLIHTKPPRGYRVTTPPNLLKVFIDKIEYSVLTLGEDMGFEDDNFSPSPK